MLIVSFDEKEILILMKANLSVFFLYVWCFHGLKEIFSYPEVRKVFSYIFFQKVLGFMFMSLTHPGFIFVQN